MFQRTIFPKLQEEIKKDTITLLIGARQTGKTTLLKKLHNDILEERKPSTYITLERSLYKHSLDQDPENIFDIIEKTTNKQYLFIDEIQYLKDPSNFLKYIYDEHKERIKLIVSGSSAFYIDKNFKDSLAGRKTIHELHTFSFDEFLMSKNEGQLINKLKDRPSLSTQTQILKRYHEYMTYGGYPGVITKETKQEKEEYLEEIATSYIKKDITDAQIKHEDKYFLILKLLATQIGNMLNINEIANTLDISGDIVENYIYTMKKSFHITTIRPFFQNIRKELTKMPKVYFLDLGLRNRFANNFEPFTTRIDTGALLENFVLMQLYKTNKSHTIRYRRTQNKNEIDFVLPNKKQAYEVKTNIKKFIPTKYKLFTQNYPEFSLSCIDFEKSLSL